MEKKFSLNEVDNFLKKFKEKRGKKATNISNNTSAKTQIISTTKPKNEDIFGNNNKDNENNKPDSIFGNNNKDNDNNKPDSIFGNNNKDNENNKPNSIFGNNNKDNYNNKPDIIFGNNNKDNDNNKPDSIFGNNNKDNENNKPDIIFGNNNKDNDSNKHDSIFGNNNKDNDNNNPFSIFGNYNKDNDNNKPDSIFGKKQSDDLFGKNNQINDDKIDNIFNNETKEDMFKKPIEKSNKQFSEKNQNLNLIDSKNEDVFDLFNNNKEKNSEDFDLFNPNSSYQKEIPKIINNNKPEKQKFNFVSDNINNKEMKNITKSDKNEEKDKFIKPKKIENINNYNNFKTGIVLNNPLENNQKQNENDNFLFNNYSGQEENENNKYDNNNNDNLECNHENNTNKNSEIKEVNYVFENNNFINDNNENKNDKNNYDENNNNIITENNNDIDEKSKYFNNNINFNNNNNNYFENQNSNTDMEKLDEDQNNNMHFNDNNNSNKQINKYKYTNDIKEINNNINQNSDLKLNYNSNSEEKIINPESYSFTSIEKNYVINASNENKIITITNIYSMLNSNSENQLYESYFPVSYSQEPDFDKLINLLNILMNNGNELDGSLSHIIAFIFKFILENQINLERINILQNNELKNGILQILSKHIQNESKGIISINNLFNAETLYNQNNKNLEYNLINEALVHPLEFMLNLFNEKIMNKNNILYLYLLLLNIKENEEFYNHGIGLDEYNYIFENFECALFIILKYFGNDINTIKKFCEFLLNSFSTKIKFCHFVILKCILGDFDIKNGRNYGNIFINFLQFPSIEKIIIADIFNFIIFTASPKKCKKIIAKSSILIKYKFSLIKQNNKPDKNLLILNQKIYENIHQFGSISKNNYFINHLKEFSSNKKLNISTQNNSTNNSNTNNPVLEENIFQKNIKSQNINRPEQVQQQGGLFSKIISAIGFGGNEINNNNITENKLSEESNKRTNQNSNSEHPIQKGVEFDHVLKRWKINGVIPEDPEEVVQKKEMEKPVIAPPKAKNFQEKKKIFNERNNIMLENIEDNKEEDNIFEKKSTGMSGGPGSINNSINNPFGYSQAKNQKYSKNNQKQKSLSERYADRFNK